MKLMSCVSIEFHFYFFYFNEKEILKISALETLQCNASVVLKWRILLLISYVVMMGKNLENYDNIEVLVRVTKTGMRSNKCNQCDYAFSCRQSEEK